MVRHALSTAFCFPSPPESFLMGRMHAPSTSSASPAPAATPPAVGCAPSGRGLPRARGCGVAAGSVASIAIISALVPWLAAAGEPAEPAFFLTQPASIAAGEFRSLELSATGPGVAVSAMQLSVRVPADSAARLTQVPSATFPQLGWNASSTTSKDQNGDVVLRVLLEAPEGESLTLSSTRQPLGYLHLHPELWTPAGAVIQVVQEDGAPDPSTGGAGCAMASADGESLVADTVADGFLDADLDRPRGGTFEFTVTEPFLYENAIFADYDAGSPYKYYQLLPTVDPVGTKLVGAALAGAGFTVNYADATGFDLLPQRAFLGVFLPPFNQDPYLSQGYYPAYPGTLLSSEWRMAGDGLQPEDALAVEVSLGSSDQNFLTRAIYQETKFPGTPPKDGAYVPYGANSPCSLRVIAEVPGFAADGGQFMAPDGMFPMGAVLARPGAGTQGSTTYFMHQTTQRIDLDHTYLLEEMFSCEGGDCAATRFAPPQGNGGVGTLPVQYSFTSEGMQVALPAGSPASGPWGGYFSTLPAPELVSYQGFIDSIGCIEVEFRFPDATPQTVPNQVIAAFREGSLDLGAIAEFRSFREPFESFGPGNSLVRRLWMDGQRTRESLFPLTIVVGVAGAAENTGPQRAIIHSVKYRRFTKNSYILSQGEEGPP